MARTKLTSPQITGLTNANLSGSAGITYANLLSTIFSGQLTSYSNTGSAGGTFQYINLGGIKLLFGLSGEFNVTTIPSANSYTINYPTSFFTTPPNHFAFLLAYSNSQAYINTSALTTTSAGSVIVTPMAGTSVYYDFWYFAIGT